MQVEALSILSKKISEHHRLYCALFNDTLKPKHHNMLHYCTIMRLSGVPSNYACDRFEANHQPSIRDARATTSRRNIALTLAVKEQLRVAHRLLLGKGLSAVLETGPESPHSFADFAILPQDFNDTDISQPKYVNYKGTKYQENSCAILCTDCDGGPLFGLVMHILLNSVNEVCLVCKVVNVISFSSHYHSYHINVTDVLKAVKVSDLFDYHPVLYCNGFDGNEYISLHHSL
ncbi:hypothetical protein ONE63_005068 [Megalurothrips usitatus]|uniref:Uncharacterized protein n=1 Tax=Megalurothrips usitatus TaxID=439358 RepID=A0AAV7X867_9NEOP|nr:hypothetical protein ONE63_005068 [Megalurothrips usitatus]